jgi:hypothetical protein
MLLKLGRELVSKSSLFIVHSHDFHSRFIRPPEDIR